jgi:Tfp pilus assembly pilus retraction ATPase PilT
MSACPSGIRTPGGMTVPKIARISGRTVTAILVDAGVVTEEQVQAGLEHQRQTGRRIGETLVDQGAVTEEDLGWALARQLGLPFVDVPVESLDRELIRSFPEGLLYRLEVVPLVRAERSLSVALSDPTDGDLIDTLERAAGCPINPGVATRTAIRAALSEVLGPPHEIHVRPPTAALTHPSNVLWDRSGASFLLFHLSTALRAGASEIHFEPGPSELRIAYRIDGRIMDVASEPIEVTYALLSRLTALGGPAIDDQSLHVLGHAVCPHGQQEIQLDISLLNQEHGIAVTLGLRPGVGRTPPLEQLGFDPVDLARIREILAEPCGLVLVTGPPRAGCSTTLSALLAAVDATERLLVAFESRPGPPLPAGIRLTLPPAQARETWAQIVEGQNADLVFLADALPGAAIEDVLCSAGSGRLVLANTDWTDSFALLAHLTSRPERRHALASRLRLVVQQRLVQVAGVEGEPGRRQGVFEVLHVHDGLRELLGDGAAAAPLRTAALADGFQPMAGQIRRLCAAGIIDTREAARQMGV